MSALAHRLAPSFSWSTVAFFALVGVYGTLIIVLHSPATSPIDEWVYLDYLYKIPQQGIVFKGEFVDPRILDLLSCHGTNPFGPIGTPCGLTPQLGDYPNGGVTSADPYTPLYFYSVFAVGSIFQGLFGISPLLAWRLSGTVWLLATYLVLWLVMRQWNLPRFTRIVLGLALLGSPFVWWTYTYVSTDASAIFFGALLLFLASRIIRNQTNHVLFVVIAVVATLFKLTNFIGVVSAVLFLFLSTVLTYLSERKRKRLRIFVTENWQLLVTSLVSVIASAASQYLWLRLHDFMAVSSATANQGAGYPFSVQEVFVQLTNFLPATITSGAIDAYTPGFVYAPLSWLTVTGVLGAAFLIKRGSEKFPLVLTVVIGALLAAPFLGIALTVVTNSYFQLPARYGAILLPGILVVTGFLMKSTWTRIVFAAYSGAIIGLGIWLAVFLAQLAP